MDKAGNSKVCEVGLLKAPFPYESMLSISTDLDETEDFNLFKETCKFLNTPNETCFGEGVGLEVANSMYFNMPEGQLAYWNLSDVQQGIARDLMKSGHIDTVHSFGDLAKSRAGIASTLHHLCSHSVFLRVWVDHAQAPSNLGPDIMRGEGDLADSSAYHADLTSDYGIRFVSRGRVSSVFGQDCERKMLPILSSTAPIRSSISLAKEMSKIILGRLGNRKYGMHSSNDMLRDISTRDGSNFVEFMRANPHPGGVSCGDDARGLADVLTERKLSKFASTGGRAILYTHLGKRINRRRGFSTETTRALNLLRRFQEDGRILVTSTERLLTFADLVRSADVSVHEDLNEILVSVRTSDPKSRPDGLGIRGNGSKPVKLEFNGRTLVTQRLDNDKEPLSWTVYVPWERLEYPHN